MPPVADAGPDRIVCLGNGNNFTVANAYRILDNDANADLYEGWKEIWKLSVA